MLRVYAAHACSFNYKSDYNTKIDKFHKIGTRKPKFVNKESKVILVQGYWVFSMQILQINISFSFKKKEGGAIFGSVGQGNRGEQSGTEFFVFIP